jgi:hypothetical protein
LNAVGICLWLGVLVLLIRKSRRGGRLSAWDWLAVLVNASAAGVYLSIGPVVWLIAHASDGREIGTDS